MDQFRAVDGIFALAVIGLVLREVFGVIVGLKATKNGSGNDGQRVILALGDSEKEIMTMLRDITGDIQQRLYDLTIILNERMSRLELLQRTIDDVSRKIDGLSQKAS